MSYINAYTFEVTGNNDEPIEVSLRLDIGAQLALQKKWNETTGDTLSGAMQGTDRFVDVLTKALNYRGNHNTISQGTDLADLLIENGMLGMKARATLINNIARVSGIYDDDEFNAIEKRVADSLKEVFSSDDESKNA